VVGEGEVLRTFSDTAQAVAEAVAKMVGRRFTSRDVRDRLERDGVDVSPRTVRRVLEEFADAGYLERHEHGNGRAHEYRTLRAPPDAEVELPSGPDLGAEPASKPGQADIGVSYTVSVRVPGSNQEGVGARTASMTLLPPPNTTATAATTANGGDRPPDAPD